LREGGVEALSFATFAADSERSAMIFYLVSGRDLASHRIAAHDYFKG